MPLAAADVVRRLGMGEHGVWAGGEDHSQLRFKHVLMSDEKNGEGKRLHPTQRQQQRREVVGGGGGGIADKQHPKSDDDRANNNHDNKIVNAVHVHVESLQKPSQQQRQERARHELDHLSRQHQRHQQQQQKRHSSSS